MSPYETLRRTYRPKKIAVLFIAESPPPPADIQSSRQFYYTDRIRKNDRLFVNTIKALYPQTSEMTEQELEQDKASWLRRFQNDGYYMIEALPESQEHEVTKQDRQDKIRWELPLLVQKVAGLADMATRIILIKSNVFDVAADPLRQAGFTVLNTELVDYPGQFNQRAYREKLALLLAD